MREFLPSATAPLPLREPGDTPVTLATVLPGAAAAVVRPDGAILLGMQVQTRSGDLSADLARALRWAQEAEPGSALQVVGPGIAGELVRLQDVLDPDAPLEVTLHPDFGWWIPPAEDGSEPAPDVAASLERANAVILPTEPVPAPGVRAAYWVDTGSKAHLRWVRPEPEEALVAAHGPAAGARRAGAHRRHPVRGVVPGPRPARAGVGSRPRAACQGVERAGGGVRRPPGRRARRRRPRSPMPNGAPATPSPASRSRCADPLR